MNFSTKMRYGTRAMIDIARTAGTDGGITIAAIAESQELSQKYLESLLVKLKNNGLLSSSRGKNGGYSLKRNPSEISLYSIYQALEGSLALVDCSPGEAICPRISECGTSGLWNHLTGILTGEMERIKLIDLMEGRYKEDLQ